MQLLFMVSNFRDYNGEMLACKAAFCLVLKTVQKTFGGPIALNQEIRQCTIVNVNFVFVV